MAAKSFDQLVGCRSTARTPSLHRSRLTSGSPREVSWPTVGSPRELVRSVVSRSGVNGASNASDEPSGLRRRIANSTRAGSRGRSTSLLIAALISESSSISRDMICAPAWPRPCSGSACDRHVLRPSQSDATGGRRPQRRRVLVRSGVTAAATRSASRFSSAPVSSASYIPGEGDGLPRKKCRVDFDAKTITSDPAKGSTKAADTIRAFPVVRWRKEKGSSGEAYDPPRHALKDSTAKSRSTRQRSLPVLSSEV